MITNEEFGKMKTMKQKSDEQIAFLYDKENLYSNSKCYSSRMSILRISPLFKNLNVHLPL